jgi:hypothetical protein
MPTADKVQLIVVPRNFVTAGMGMRIANQINLPTPQDYKTWRVPVAWVVWVTSQNKWDTQTMTHWTLSATLSSHSFNKASVQKVVCSLRDMDNYVVWH